MNCADSNAASCACSEKARGFQPALFPDMNQGKASSFAPRISGGNAIGSYYKVKISSQGLYRISQSNLKAAGFLERDLIGSRLQMFNRDVEIPIFVSTTGPMDPSDFILFYAEGYNGTHTDNNVYWIGLGNKNGKRMAWRNAAPISGITPRTSYCATSYYAPKKKWIPYFRPGDETFDHWFDEIVAFKGSKKFSFSLDQVVHTGTSSIAVEIGSWEVLGKPYNTPYTINLLVNGFTAGSLTYLRNTLASASQSFQSSFLRSGNTTITLKNTSSSCMALPKEIKLQYTRNLVIQSGRLSFQGETGVHNYRVRGITGTTAWLLDISDSLNPVLLKNASLSAEGGGYYLEFGDILPDTSACYFVADERNSIDLLPKRITHAGNANTESQADYLIITPAAFKSSAQGLAARRSTQGFQTKVILLENIYDEFSYGIEDPAALRQFLGFTFHHWKSPSPRFVMLIGDATYDPKNFQKKGLADVLPTHFGGGIDSFTSQDMWFGLVNGSDTGVDIAIGRVPVTSNTSLLQFINKVNIFENAASSATWRKKTTWAADDRDAAGDFKGRSNEFISKYFAPKGFSCLKAYLDDMASETARSIITDGFASGRFMIHYSGHGSTTSWSSGSKYMLNYNTAMQLRNVVYPIVPIWACNTGAFHSDSESLAEGLIEQGRGAAACISATSEAFEIVSARIGHGLFSAMIRNKTYRIGTAMQRAFQYGWEWSPSSPELLFYNLFGDPALIVNPVSGRMLDSDGDGMDDSWEALHGLEPYIADAQEDADKDSLVNLTEYAQNLNPINQDTDHDKLPDAWEIAAGSDPAKSDSDNDGMDDRYELLHQLNPRVNDAGLDPDNDGLSNLIESQHQLNPRNPDSDLDGLSDKYELDGKQTDPRLFDTDQDGIGDGEEKNVFGTNPLNPDSNNDGMPDGWVLSYGIGIDQAGPHADPDADGLKNLEEFYAGTFPNNSDSDQDGLSDGDEVIVYGSNPLHSDSDQDGLQDGEEVFTFKTSPTLLDSDGDRLDDAWEIDNKYNPLKAEVHHDSDRDGLLNVEEVLLGLNPTLADMDEDGLPDGDEINTHGTNPFKIDTDNDGLEDKEEIYTHATNPLSKDTDQDQLNDDIEIAIGSNPNKSDTDNDGLSDFWEWTNGLNFVFSGDAFWDKDSDGLNNTHEHTIGTKPNDPDTDNDGLNDGLEVNIYDTNPTRRDMDYDGLNDYAEIKTYGTLPKNPDTDNDGMKDGWEIYYGLNPLNPNDATGDLDGDTLSNAKEAELYLNPQKTDSDMDGLSDSYEVARGMIARMYDRDNDGLNDGEEVLTYGTNPSKPDTDQDGITDGYEINLYQTNPLKKDTDDDGIPDNNEVLLGLNPVVQDAHFDGDRDGLNNLQEYQAKTDINNPDSDEDGLSDRQELNIYLTQALSSDSDEDGVSDGDEVNTHRTNPLSADTDGDGMPDSWEIDYGTDPLRSDRLLDYDRDGLPNHQEYLLGSHPLKADSDEDGLSDFEEIQWKTSSALSDTDHDGLSDLYEIMYGLNPLVEDAQLDKDLDGLSNKEEYRRNSNPSQRNSFTHIPSRMKINAPDNLALSWTSQTNARYTILSCTNLLNCTKDLYVIENEVLATPPENTVQIKIKHPFCVYWVEEE